VVDWGLAKRLGVPEAASQQVTDQTSPALESSDLTDAGQVLGTPAYMSPEQAAGQAAELGPATDIYALGAILYELLTNQPPFRDAPREILNRLDRGERPLRPRLLARGIPPALEAIAWKAMAPLPGDRYPATHALADDLERYLADEAVSAQVEPLVQRLARFVRRRQAVVAAVLALLLTGVVALSISTLLVSRAQHETSQALSKEATAKLEAQIERKSALEALHTSRVAAANLAFDRGQTLGDRGDTGAGMLWMIRGLEYAPADEKPLRQAMLASLALWRGQLNTLQARFEPRLGTKRGSLNAAAFLHGGQSVFVTGELPAAWICDAATGRQVGDPLAHTAAVKVAAVSADGNLAITGCADGTVRLWDLISRATLHPPWKHEGAVTAVAFHPDGSIVATAGFDRTAKLWSVATGEQVGETMHHAKAARALAFHPDGKVLLAGADFQILRWDALTGLEAGQPMEHTSHIVALACSPDGHLVLSGDMAFGAQLWDFEQGLHVAPPLAHPDGARCVAFHPSGRIVASGGGGGFAQLWDVKSGLPVGQPVPHLGDVSAIAFDDSGERLITVSLDASLRVWTPVRPPRSIAIPNANAAMPGDGGGFAIRPDGGQAAFGSLRGAMVLVDASSGQLKGPPGQAGGPVGALAFSPDGHKLLMGGLHDVARVYDPHTWQLAGPDLSGVGPVKAVAFAAQGRQLLTASLDGLVQVWDAETGQRIGPVMKHPGGSAIVGTADGRLIATGGMDGYCRLWEIPGGKLLHEFKHQGDILSIALSPDGQSLAAAGTTARVWDTATGQPVTPRFRHQGPVMLVAFSRDGRWLLTNGVDKTTRLWDLATGRRLGPQVVHPHRLVAARFSAANDRIDAVTSGWHEEPLVSWPVRQKLTATTTNLKLWAEVLSGLEMDPAGDIHPLSVEDWSQRRKHLSALNDPQLR
jgi:WD40 repeat protein